MATCLGCEHPAAVHRKDGCPFNGCGCQRTPWGVPTVERPTPVDPVADLRAQVRDQRNSLYLVAAVQVGTIVLIALGWFVR